MSEAESRVKVSADQELTASDVNAMQVAQQQTVDAVVASGLGVVEAYTGLGITQQSATDIQMATGRYWKNGLRYLHDGNETISLLAQLPTTGNKRIVSIAVNGAENETDSDTRRFLVDATPGQETSEPRPTSTRVRRQLAYSLIAGAQGPVAVNPSIPAGNLEIARVQMNEAGIVSITMVAANRLTTMAALEALYNSINVAFTKTRGDVASLRSDLSDLATQIKAKANQARVDLLASTVSSLAHRMNVAGVRVGLNRDTLQDDDLTDTAFALYAAVADFGGIRFPNAAEAQAYPLMLNPYDPGVQTTTGGLTLPKFTENARITNDDADFSIRPMDATSASYTFRQLGLPRTSIYYGPFSDRDWVRFDQAQLPTVKVIDPDLYVLESLPSLDANWRLQTMVRSRGAAKIRVDEPFPPIHTANVVKTGAAVAQVFLNSRLGWLTSIGIGFKTVALDGIIVNVAICGVLPSGAPDLSNTLAITSVVDLLDYGVDGFTYVPIEPVLLRPGERYAAVFVTAGGHTIGMSDAQRNMMGGIFHYLDGSAFAPTMIPDRDLTLSFRFAEFANSRTVLTLSPLTLVGGIENFKADLTAYEPNGTSITIEGQVGGVWRPFDTADLTALATAPNLIPLRMVFKGSSYAMPAVWLPHSRLVGFRRADAFRHISKVITNGGTSTAFTLRLRLRNYRAAVHTLTASLLSGAGYTTVTAAASTSYDKDYFANGDDLMIFTFAPSAISSFRWRLDGSTTAHGETFQITERTDVEV
jgi:hypothetical protein